MYPHQFHIIKYLLFTLINTSLFLYGCKTTFSKDQDNDIIRKIAIDKLGNAIDSHPNSTGEYILYIQKTNSLNTSNYLKLLVINVSDHRVIHEQSFNPGYAKWINDSSIEVLSVPGTIRKNENLSDYKKIINIANQKQNEH